MALLTENFDGYNDGDLNGQGNWAGSTDFDIQGTVVKEGAKAVTLSGGNSRSIVKTGTSTADGTLSFWHRQDVDPARAVDIDSGLIIQDSDGTNIYIVRFRRLSDNSAREIAYNDGDYQTIGAFTDSVWYKVEIEWRSSDNKARYRIDEGNWTAWFDGASSGTPAKVALYTGSSGPQVADAAYWDEIGETSGLFNQFFPKRDSFMDKNLADTNYGSGTFLGLNGVALRLYRSILYFDLTNWGGSIGQKGVAKLRLYYYDYNNEDPAGLAVNVYKLTQPAWTEAGVTWNRYDGGNLWTVAGGDYNAGISGSGTIPTNYGWMEIDIMDIVTDAITNESSKLHLIVLYNDEAREDDETPLFYSNDEASQTTKRPRLILEAVDNSSFYGANF